MGYSKTIETDTLSVSDTNIIAQLSDAASYSINAGDYYKYFQFTVVSTVTGKARFRWSFDYMATAPDWVQVDLRINGVSVETTAQFVGAWVNVPVDEKVDSLKIGDTLEFWARANTGATAQMRNIAIYASRTPFYGWSAFE